MNDNKSSKYFKLFLILFLVFVLISGSFFVVYKYVILKEDLESSSEINNSHQDKNNNDALPVEPKDYITDASYKIDNAKDSYYFYEELVRASDIVVPYLNIDAPAAQKINNEIKDLYENFMNMYNEFSQENLNLDLDNTESYDYIKSKYTYTINNDLLSILIKVSYTGRGSSVAEDYYAFNYDMKENKTLFLEDLCKRYGIIYEDAIKKVNETLDISFDKNFDFVDFSSLELREESDEYIKLNKEYFANQVKNKKENVYIDETNQLNIIVLNEHPFGGCGFYSDFIVF